VVSLLVVLCVACSIPYQQKESPDLPGNEEDQAAEPRLSVSHNVPGGSA
jgi:hypothetical protein